MHVAVKYCRIDANDFSRSNAVAYVLKVTKYRNKPTTIQYD